MPKTTTEEDFVRVSTRDLRTVRDTLIALGGLIAAMAKEQHRKKKFPHGSFLYIERSLDREAVTMSDWLGEFSQEKLPF